MRTGLPTSAAFLYKECRENPSLLEENIKLQPLP